MFSQGELMKKVNLSLKGRGKRAKSQTKGDRHKKKETYTTGGKVAQVAKGTLTLKNKES